MEPIPPFPQTGRSHRERRLTGPGETAPSGRLRLDAIADWLQQVAFADVVDAGVEGDAVWVLRRTRLRVERFPRLRETVALETACSGYGASWAERRTRLRGDRGGRVEAVALWVALDPATQRPMRLGERFLGVYGASAGGRRVRARLRHPGPPDEAPAEPWLLRAAELDVAGHVNNAACWRAVEQFLPEPADGAALEAEVEYHAPAAAGPASLVRDGARAWLLAGDGRLHASIALDGADG